MNVFNATDGNGRGVRATNGKELSTAITQALAHKRGPTLIESTIDRNDCTKELMERGSRVAAANRRAPQLAQLAFAPPWTASGGSPRRSILKDAKT
jgi:indolepyruvate decarboxylase